MQSRQDDISNSAHCFGARFHIVAILVWLATAIAALAAEPPKNDAPAKAEKAVVVESATDQTAADEPLLFRRTYVPADRIDDWPRGNQRYLPMDFDDFARAVQGSTKKPTNVSASATAQVVHAAYEARLVGDDLVDGRATLQVQRKDPNNAAGKSTLLELGPCGLAIDAPHWTPPPPVEISKPKRPPTTTKPAAHDAAIFGATSDGATALAVDLSGSLEFAWSFRGRRDTGGELAFDLQLPRCPSNRLTLGLPADLAPTVSAGLVAPLDERAPTGSQIRRWQIELGGQTNVVLRVLKEELVEKPHCFTLIHQSSAYDFSPRGMQLTVELKLDVLGDPIREIPLWIDAPLELTTARCGENQIPWIDAQRSASSGGKRRQIVLQFAEPLRGKGRSVRLAAMAPLPASRSLPNVRLASSEMFWQDGSASLLILAPLEIGDLKLAGCRQTKAEPLAAPLAGNAITLQYFQPDPQIELALRQCADRFQVRSGTTLDLRGNRLTGSMLADLTAAQGECFAIEASVSPSWIIDAVESVPAGAVAGWTRDPDGADGRLSINLNRAVRTDHPLRLAIAGHWRRRPLGQRFHVHDLELAHFEGFDGPRRLVSIHAAAPYRLRMSGDEELNRLDPAHLAAADAGLLGTAPGEIAFDADAAADELALTINSEPPKLSGDIHLDARLTDDALNETYTFACVLESAELDHALVRFSRPSPEPLRWNFSSPATDSHEAAHQIVSARRLSAEEQAALGVIGSGELWEVTWPQSPGATFTLEAVRSVPLAKSLAIGLASLPQANSQFGTVTIRSSAERLPEIDNRRLKPAAIPAPESSRWPDALAAYTYEPQEEAVSAASNPNPSLSIRPAVALPTACVWSARLDSHYLAGGASEHVAVLRIENNGRRTMSIQMPAAASLHAAWIDGVLTNTPRKIGVGAKASLDLPAGQRFLTVVLEWGCADAGLGLIANRETELPQCDMPVLSRRVNIWLPPQYQLVDAPGLTDIAAASWTQRLFGPFGRAAGEPPFDPVRAEAWADAFGRALHRDPGWRQAQAIDGELRNRAAGTEATTGALTWADLLNHAQVEVARQWGPPSRPLLIDRQALADIGIGPRSAVDGSTLSRGERASLANADLVLLVDAKGILLTTRSAAARWQQDGTSGLPASSNTVVERLSPGPLAVELAAGSGSARFVPAEFWTNPDVKLPWSPASSDARIPDHVGWTMFALDAAPEGVIPLRLVCRSAMVALGCTLFVLTALVVWLFGGGLPRSVELLCVAIAVVAALLVPAYAAPLGAGGILGIVAGCCLRRLVSATVEQPDSREAKDSSSVSRRRFVTASLLFCGAVLVAVSAASAAPREAAVATPKRPAAATIYDVLIPVDKDQKPSGRQVFVPEPLYQAIVRRRDDASPPTPPKWLLTAASYYGAIVQGADSFAVGSAAWTAAYDLQTLEANTEVKIPFDGDSASLLPDGVRLDGQAVEFQSLDKGRRLAFSTPTAGAHHLEISFRPTLRAAAPDSSVELAIPPLPNARIQLDYPPGARIEIPTARGALDANQKSGCLTGSLGAADRLVIHCSQNNAQESKTVLGDADELLWLKLRAGSAMLEARFNVRIAAGHVQQLRIAIDPRLRLLPPDAASAIAAIRPETGTPSIFQLQLAKPTSGPATFKLAFLLTDGSALGNLQLPRLELLDVASINRQLALSVEPPLAYVEPAHAPQRSLPVAQFAAAWGAAEQAPQVAWQIPASEPRVSLQIKASQPQVAATEQLAVVCQLQRLTVALLCNLSVQGDNVYQVRFPASDQLTIDDVSLLDSGMAERPVHWSRGDGGKLIVFLPGPSAEQYRLLIRGQLPYAGNNPVVLPALRPDDCAVDSQTVLVFRRREVQTTMADRGGLRTLGAQETTPAIDQALADGLIDRRTLAQTRLAVALSGKSSGPQRALNIAPNSPRVEGSETITVRRENDVWTASADLDLKISGGVLDMLRFELPPQWPAAAEITPATPSEIVDVPGESRRLLVLHPVEPLAGEHRFHLSGPMVAVAGQRLRAPDIRPLDVGRLRRIVLLPTRSSEQQLSWQTRGLNVEPLPGGFSSESPQVELYRTCIVVGETFEARLKSVEKMAERPRAQLADVRVTFTGDRGGFGVATFDVEPAGAASFLLNVPAADRLVQVAVNGQPAALDKAAANQWVIGAASPKLPQRIEATFEFTLNDAAENAAEPKLAAPWLAGCTVDQTIWSVDGGRWSIAPQGRRANVMSPLTQAVVRVQTVSRELESVAAALTDEAPEDIAAAYLPWARRLLVARAAVQRERSRMPANQAAQTAAAEMRTVDETQAKLARKFNVWSQFTELSSQRPMALDAGEISESVPRAGKTAAFAVAGPSPSLTLISANETSGDFVGRLFAACLAVAVLGAVGKFGHRPAVREFVARWPQLLAVLLALAWWLWLAPSLFGCPAIAMILVVPFVVQRHRRSPPTST